MMPDTSAASTSSRFSSVSISHIPAPSSAEVLNLPCRGLRDYLTASNIKDDPHPSGLNDVTKSTLDYWKNHFSFLFRGKNNLQKDILEDEIKKIVKDTTRLTTFLKMNLNVNVEIPLSDAEKNDINVDSAKSNVIANTKTFVKELSYMDNLEVNQAIDKEIELLMNYKKHLNKGNDKHQ